MASWWCDVTDSDTFHDISEITFFCRFNLLIFPSEYVVLWELDSPLCIIYAFMCQYPLHSIVWCPFGFMLQCWWWISGCYLLFWKWTLLEGLSTRLFISFGKYLEIPFRSLLLFMLLLLLSEVNWACYPNCILVYCPKCIPG